MVIVVVKTLLVLVSVMVGVALLTVLERKYMSGIQRRRGPNVVGVYGLLQAISDGVKLLVKETTRPMGTERTAYFIAPLVTFVVSYGVWGLVPVGEGALLGDVEMGLLYVVALSSVGVYGVLLGGYISNSKYAFYGGVRSTAQMISYEVSLGLLLGVVLVSNGGMTRLVGVVHDQEGGWKMMGLLPVFVMYVISIVAETNRHPFDLPEAESELVSGYNVEYSAGGFVLYFLGEYGSIMMMSALVVIMFMGGWLQWGVVGMALKIGVVVLVFVWARAAYPRYRYDQLMLIGWKVMLPLAVGLLVVEMGKYVVSGWRQ